MLEGEVAEFEHFAGAENSQWIIDVAHGLCDPRQKRGQLWVWDSNGHDSPVVVGNPLQALVYEYRIPVHVRLTKISRRHSKSVTASVGVAKTMKTVVSVRDGHCWISRARRTRNSHVCPKRMGDEQARFIYEEFTDTATPRDLTIFDPHFVISLTTNLDDEFDLYRIGLKPTNDVC